MRGSEGADWMLQVRRAAPFLRPYRRAALLLLLLAVVGAGLGAVEPLAMMFIFDGLTGATPLRGLALGLALLAGIGIAREGLSFLSNGATWRTRIGLQYDLLERTIGRLSLLPVSYHREQAVGRTMTRLDRGISGFVSAASDMLTGVLPAAAYLSIAVVIMFRLEWRLSLLVLAFAPLPVLIGARAARPQAKRERILLRRWSSVYGRFSEVLSGIETVKSFGMEEEEKRRFLRGVSEANRVVLKGVGYDSGVGAAKNLTATVARLAAVGLGSFLVLRGDITVGVLVAFLGYVGGVFGPVQGLTGVYQSLRRAGFALETIFSILDAQETPPVLPGARVLKKVRGEVAFDQVSFAYDGDEPTVRNVSFLAEPGQMVALVGPSGSGKSTLMALLQRFYDPTEGTVRVDGHDLREVEPRSLRRHIGVVLQESLLFQGSVRANIAYGRPGASRKDIERAAKIANAHDFIMGLPDGYDTLVAERGARLSGGERQRVAIARALLKNPPILIFDEATSALDAESEAAVREALRRLVRDRTAFVIAHRLGIAADADRILVLRRGRIVEAGDHETLMARDGFYAELVRLQTEGLASALAL